MEDLEKQFFSSYESYLSAEGKEICKEIDSIIGDNNKLMIEKCKAYYYFIDREKSSDLDPKLVEKCKKVYKHFRNYDALKCTLEHLNYNRR